MTPAAVLGESLTGDLGPAAAASGAARLLGNADPGKSPAWHVLRQRRFAIYFAGTLISNLGTWLQNTAQVVLAYQLTHSAFAVGAVACAQFSGFLLLGPMAARLADRIGGRRLLMGTQLASALIAASMAVLRFTGLLTEGPLIAGAFGLGLAFTLAIPVQTAMLSRLVSKRDTRAALTMNSVSYNTGRTLAPALGVVIIFVVGVGWDFMLNAISFLLFTVTLWGIYPRSAGERETRPPALAGVQIVLWRPRIILLLAMVAAITMAEDPILVLGPSLARQALHAPNVWAGYFLSALGLGTIIGALLPSRQLATPRLASSRAATSLLLLAVSVVVFTWGFGTWVSLVAAVIAGLAGLQTGSAAQALLLQIAGPRLAAKVMALWAIAWAGSKPIASLSDGLIANTIGIRWGGLLLATPALIVGSLELALTEAFKKRVKAVLTKAINSHYCLDSESFSAISADVVT